MKIAFLPLLVFLAAHSIAAQPLPRSTPEAQGVSSAGVREFIEAADRQVDTMHSFMLVRHGRVVAEAWWKPESAEKPHVLYSLSKSFTSTAVGLAVAEGKLNVDDPVLKFFPDDAPAQPSDKLKAMRVRDLLTMSTGHQTEPKLTAEATWVKSFLAHPVEHKPGAHFLYNSAGTYLCSAIVQKVSGQTVLDYLRPRLFEPLGIEGAEWSASPQGISAGGWGLFLKTEDIAKFGQLFLQKGKWGERLIVPASWVEQATAKQVSNGSDPTKDWDQGYGFQFWRCRHGAYRGDGAFGQFCIVMPEQDAVVAITADTKDMQAELNIVWKKLLPAFQKEPLPENADEQVKLKTTLAALAVREGHVPNTIKLPGAAANTRSKSIETITTMPGLVAFWTFGEDAGQPRVSTGTREKFPLAEVGGPVARVGGGPFSGSAAELNGRQFFKIPYAGTGGLNISGPDAQVSMFAVVRIVNLQQSRTIAGIWSEGRGAHDDTGTRQYALLMNMPTYGGPRQLTPHISSEGGVTRRADGSAFPWCADYAATQREVPEERWCSLGFTYDGKFIRAYIDGVLDARPLDAAKDRRADPYFTAEGPDGRDRGMNPYFHGRGIFRYDPAKHAQTKPGGGADFTVGARYAVGSMLGEATVGRFGGLAVFSRAITDAEMKTLHDAANVGALNK